MGIWNPTVFLNKNMGTGTPCTTWAWVSSFDDDWQDSAYWWNQRVNPPYYNVVWNNGCAIRLLIEKCNSLQDQIDEGGGVVDMTAILNAMWAAESWETLLFIPYIDAMRGSISEKTVTGDAMGRFLRHFIT